MKTTSIDDGGRSFRESRTMELGKAQQADIQERYGICVHDACDTCGKLLGYLRHTRKDQRGEWCSELCRDGQAIAKSSAERRRNEKRRIEKARAGRESARTAQNVAARS
jgi:hypothetical protein